jgi:hypothetical protein
MCPPICADLLAYNTSNRHKHDTQHTKAAHNTGSLQGFMNETLVLLVLLVLDFLAQTEIARSINHPYISRSHSLHVGAPCSLL